MLVRDLLNVMDADTKVLVYELENYEEVITDEWLGDDIVVTGTRQIESTMDKKEYCRLYGDETVVIVSSISDGVIGIYSELREG